MKAVRGESACRNLISVLAPIDVLEDWTVKFLNAWLVLLSVAFLPVMTGCNPDEFGELVPAGGVVTLDGKPVAGVAISAIPQEGVKGRGGYGVTDSDGAFSLQVDTDAPGLPAGTYRLLLQKYAMPDGSPIPENASAADTNIANVLPPVYSSDERSPVYVTFPTPDGMPTKVDLKSKLR